MEEEDATTDYSIVLLFFYSVGIIVYAAHKALEVDVLIKKSESVNEEELTIKLPLAIGIPFISSIFLLSFYYFFSYLSFFMAIVSLVMAVLSAIFCIYSPLLKIITAAAIKLNAQVSPSKMKLMSVVTSVATGLFVALNWLMTGNPWTSNAIATSICVSVISVIRMPSIKIATLLLGALLVYDVFWVFCSEAIFGHNVMLDVATRPTMNPAVTVAKSFNIDLNWVTEIHLPMKLIWGNHLLGLGDIALPGIFIAYAMRIDAKKTGRPSWRGYFRTGLMGYCVGLVLAFMAANVFRVAQPALIYLVPSSLIPIVIAASRAGELSLLWHGPAATSNSTEAETSV